MHKHKDTNAKRVIIVDSDSATTELIAEIITSIGCESLCYARWLLSAESIERAQAQLLILELIPGDSSAVLDLLGELRRNPHTRALPVIVNSTDSQLLDQLAESLRDLSCAMLAKPFELDDFFSSIRMCLDIGSSQMQQLACGEVRAERN
jgi:DNA-binding NtrC family response regulator